MALKITSLFTLAVATTSNPLLVMDQSTNIKTATQTADTITTPAAQNSFKSGFGVGASVGYNFVKSKIQMNMDIAMPRVQAFYLQGIDASVGVISGLFFDYQKVLSSGWVLGGVLSFSLDAQTLSKQSTVPGLINASMKTMLKRSYALEPMLVFGRKVSDKAALLAQVGSSFGWFKEVHTFTSGQRTIMDKFKATKIGFIVGAKAVYAFTPNFSGFLGVDYTHYGKTSRNYKPIALNRGVPLPNQIHRGSVTYFAVTPRLGATYRF